MQKRMNWQALSFDWNQTRAFLAVLETGSLSAAARVLGQTQPTLGRQVAALEAALGVVLFERVGRGLTPTPLAHDLAAHVRDMREAAARISLTASGQSQDVTGDVVLSASEGISACILPPILARLKQVAPGITVELLVSNDISDLARREADIAIRHIRPTGPDLIARQVFETTPRFYAATTWIARHGRPATLAEAQAAGFVGVDRTDRYFDWMRRLGLELTPANIVAMSQNTIAGWELVRQGLGIGAMLPELAARMGGGVERVLEWLPDYPIPYWLVSHREVQTARRIRIVYDLLAEELSALSA